ncbi:DUF6894 family protein [Sphingosinicella terrae]|uniref:DUF6894 family protein n=1 Tax=Sphingosinicella terrae TaxID=2172047 RepID=UPI000E0D4BC6|nr:hypothetical protein [Sphingosinicella terrae]
MTLYYFHLRDGEDILLDPEGRDLGSMEAIREATLREARSIISSDSLEGKVKLSYRLDVEDESGKVVHRLQFEDAVSLQRGRVPE